MDPKSLLGALAVAVGVVGYVPYFRDIFHGTTKPHVFSWFIWGLLTGIVFFAQVAKGGGAGAWVTGLTAITCLTVAALALIWGEKNITRLDWWSFAGALAAMSLWSVTKDPLLAVIVTTVIDALAFVPTFRKSFRKPYEETVTLYMLSALKFLIAFPAFASFNLATVLYPASLVFMNSAFVGMVLVRRRTR